MKELAIITSINNNIERGQNVRWLKRMLREVLEHFTKRKPKKFVEFLVYEFYTKFNEYKLKNCILITLFKLC